tara:strand:+ start:8106 stop:8642 length:537 start_codon:yes stop_codon:yes gene_type:complete
MARHIHKALYYEKEQIQRAKHRINALNTIVWEMHHEFGEDFVKNNLWTYGMGIRFKNTTKAEFNKIKTMLDGLSVLNKKSSQFQLELEGILPTGFISYQGEYGDIHTKEMELEISFKWGIPDSCEIKDVETVTLASGDFFTGDDGEIYHRKTDKVVECTQPLLESVFSKDNSHHEQSN